MTIITLKQLTDREIEIGLRRDALSYKQALIEVLFLIQKLKKRSRRTCWQLNELEEQIKGK